MSEKFVLEDLLNALIELESTGHNLYTELHSRVENENVAELFGTLAKQELKHKDIYQGFKTSLIVRENVDVEYLKYVKVMLEKNIKFLSSIAIPEDMHSSVCQAVQLEKDTILFLIEMKKLIEEHHKDDVDKIINEERSHLKYLYELEY